MVDLRGFKSFDGKIGSSDFLKSLFDNGINVMPIPAKTKEPVFKWKTYERNKVTQEQFDLWFKDKEIGKDTNYAIICGEISDNLMVIDIDEKEMFDKLFKEDILENTLVVKTLKGYHVYFYSFEPIHSRKFTRFHVELRSEGNYVIGPFCSHPSGISYEIISKTVKIDRVDGQAVYQRIRKILGIDKIKVQNKEIPAHFKYRIRPCLELVRQSLIEEGRIHEVGAIEHMFRLHLATDMRIAGFTDFEIHGVFKHAEDYSYSITQRHLDSIDISRRASCQTLQELDPAFCYGTNCKYYEEPKEIPEKKLKTIDFKDFLEDNLIKLENHMFYKRIEEIHEKTKNRKYCNKVKIKKSTCNTCGKTTYRRFTCDDPSHFDCQFTEAVYRSKKHVLSGFWGYGNIFRIKYPEKHTNELRKKIIAAAKEFLKLNFKLNPKHVKPVYMPILHYTNWNIPHMKKNHCDILIAEKWEIDGELMSLPSSFFNNFLSNILDIKRNRIDELHWNEFADLIPKLLMKPLARIRIVEYEKGKTVTYQVMETQRLFKVSLKDFATIMTEEYEKSKKKFIPYGLLINRDDNRFKHGLPLDFSPEKNKMLQEIKEDQKDALQDLNLAKKLNDAEKINLTLLLLEFKKREYEWTKKQTLCGKCHSFIYYEDYIDESYPEFFENRKRLDIMPKPPPDIPLELLNIPILQ